MFSAYSDNTIAESPTIKQPQSAMKKKTSKLLLSIPRQFFDSVFTASPNASSHVQPLLRLLRFSTF
jgi:hypothetical protein